MNTLQKAGGIAAISEAIIYILAFIFFGAFWHYPSGESTITQLSYLTETQFIYSAVNMMMYVFFGVILSVITLALYERIKSKSPAVMQVATIFGVIWVTLVIASGMISTVGLRTIIEMSSAAPEQAMTVWATISAIVQGLGGGNEIVGGLWVLLLSIAAIRSNELSKSFNYFGLVVGATGISTIYPSEALTSLFGVSQIVWFLWLGVIMLKK